jgi:nitrogen fixation NifU-like protein
MEDLLRKSGYSTKAIEYYTGKVHVGWIRNPSVELAFTGPCGDTLKIYLNIDSELIKDAKFEAVGCAGAFSAGSALMEMIRGKSISEAESIRTEEIIEHLGGVPENKKDCVLLTKTTLDKTLQLYKKENQGRH